MVIGLLIAYFAALALLALLGVHRLMMVATVLQRPEDEETCAALGLDAPLLLVQLPLYNEAFVAERALRAAAAMRYPARRLRIQVLDDSTDETARLVDRVAEELRVARGIQIEVLRRQERHGFKAGALAAGLIGREEELVALFDADFAPPPDFLERTVPLLVNDPRCGMVQARWGFHNGGTNALTRAQAVLLDAHFGIEHRARWLRGDCFNFNGTAGVWRRSAIESAGGWQADTITEDLDLSYRAQLAGWRFQYVDALLVPSELPEGLGAFAQQQARWVRGSIETARKLLPQILAHRDWSARKRLEAAVHLLSNGAWVLMAIIALLLPATVVIRDRLGAGVPGGEQLAGSLDLVMLTSGTLAMLLFYAVSSRTRGPVDLLLAMCLGAGISLSNAGAALKGLFARGSEFLRTPKRGDARADLARLYRSAPRWRLLLIEAVFAVYFAAASVYAVDERLFGALPFLVLYLTGFAWVAAAALRAR
jgi:hypothetical protein